MNKIATDAKMESLKKTLANPKNSLWTGAMAKIEAAGCDTSKLGLSQMFEGKAALPPGEEPWLVCAKAWAWRFGPNSWALPGAGGWVMPMSPHCILIVFKSADFVNQGVVALGDLAAFLESATGQAMTKNSVILVDMRGSRKLCWVPFGYLVAPLYAPISAAMLAPDGKVDDGKSASATGSSSTSAPAASSANDEFAFLWCLSVLNGGMASAVVDREWAPIAAYNMAHFEKTSSSALWSVRAQAFKAMCDARTT